MFLNYFYLILCYNFLYIIRVKVGDIVLLLDIFIIGILFILGIFVGFLAIIIGLKAPLKQKEYFNTCDYCNEKYKWHELIPIFSFFLSRGECKHCNNNLSLWYPFLELLTGLLFAFSFMIYGFSYEMLIMIILTILSIIIYVSDFKYYIILDIPLFICGILVLILKFIFFGFETFLISLCSGLLIFIFMLIIKYIGDKIFKQESLGGGDIKLAMFFGFVFGIRLSIVALILGSFFAFPYAVYFSLTNKQREIPFGPFLITGLFVVFVFMEQINTFLSIIF